MTFLATASLLASLLLPPAAEAQEFEQYTVVEGDTCASIAERYYGSPRRYGRIHDHNPDLGPLPHRLHAGMILRLPLPRESGADATVTDARGSVRRQLPTDADWSGARIGDELLTGARVSTGERSSAELTFRASTVAAIRAETLVIVHGGSVERVRAEGSHAILREGSILSRLSSLSGGAPLLVETPIAEVEVTGGETSIHVQTNGDTAVSAHSGSAARVRTTGGAEAAIEVPVGRGTHVRRGRAPSPPQPLPLAPDWASGPRAFLGLFPSGANPGGGALSGGWLPVTNAATYRVEIARREDGRDLVFQASVPASVTRFEAYGLPPGRYYVRVATLDAEMLEGRPTAPTVFDIVGVRLLGPTEEPPAAAEGLALLEELDALADTAFLMTDAPTTPSALVGTRVLVPEGVVCAAGTSEPSHELVFTEAGDTFLTCVDPEGSSIVGLDLSVVRVRAEVLTEGGEVLGTLPRDAVTDVRISLDSNEVAPSALVLVTEGGSASEPTLDDEGTLHTSLSPLANGSAPMTLAFALRSAPDVVLGTIDLPVEAPAPEAPPAEVARTSSLHEGLGLFAMPSWVGLRDEQRTGVGGTLGITVASARLGEPDVRVRLIAGATAGLWDDYLRISAAAPLDVIGQAARSADRGARDVYFSLGSRVLRSQDTDGVGLAFEVGMWAPTAGSLGLDRGRLMVAGDFSYRFAERLALRTRQSGIFDLSDSALQPASILWASAYGFDVQVEGPLSLGIEGTVTLGSEDGRAWYAGGVGLGVGIDLSPVVISLAGRYGFGDDLWPTATIAANVRASFDP